MRGHGSADILRYDGISFYLPFLADFVQVADSPPVQNRRWDWLFRRRHGRRTRQPLGDAFCAVPPAEVCVYFCLVLLSTSGGGRRRVPLGRTLNRPVCEKRGIAVGVNTKNACSPENFSRIAPTLCRLLSQSLPFSFSEPTIKRLVNSQPLPL